MSNRHKLTKKIIVADDEIFNIHAIVGLMRVLGFDDENAIDTCTNGEQMVNLIEKAI